MTTALLSLQRTLIAATLLSYHCNSPSLSPASSLALSPAPSHSTLLHPLLPSLTRSREFVQVSGRGARLLTFLTVFDVVGLLLLFLSL